MVGGCVVWRSLQGQSVTVSHDESTALLGRVAYTKERYVIDEIGQASLRHPAAFARSWGRWGPRRIRIEAGIDRFELRL
jgi:hypothetical protein